MLRLFARRARGKYERTALVLPGRGRNGEVLLPLYGEHLTLDHLRAEALRLALAVLQQLHAADRLGKAVVVFDFVRLCKGAVILGDNECLKIGPRSIDRGRDPRGTSADDDDIVHPVASFILCLS